MLIRIVKTERVGGPAYLQLFKIVQIGIVPTRVISRILGDWGKDKREKFN